MFSISNNTIFKNFKTAILCSLLFAHSIRFLASIANIFSSLLFLEVCILLFIFLIANEDCRAILLQISVTFSSNLIFK